jgi:hypothetical protein
MNVRRISTLIVVLAVTLGVAPSATAQSTTETPSTQGKTTFVVGTTEVGVILVNYPGARDFPVKPGSLGKPIPDGRLEVQDTHGAPCPPGRLGEIKVWRRGAWLATKDLGYTDAQHIHDAAWYVTGKGRDQEVYLLFTNWNPGGRRSSAKTSANLWRRAPPSRSSSTACRGNWRPTVFAGFAST